LGSGAQLGKKRVEWVGGKKRLLKRLKKRVSSKKVFKKKSNRKGKKRGKKGATPRKKKYHGCTGQLREKKI